MEGLVTMSDKELDRLRVLERVISGALTQRAAAEMLGLTARQVRRLERAYQAHGAGALASKRRGRPSNRKLAPAFRKHVLELVRTLYTDFGPTLASEKLREHHGTAVSVETLRTWMTEAGLWHSRMQRRRRPQQPRHRRECLGELVQIDGCDHEWFEDRAPRCTLLVYVDDATSRLMHLQFVRYESTFDYFDATQQYLGMHGKPVAFYSDKAAIFRVNAKDARAGDGYTQFDLNVDVICANSPAAKGRVERAHQTLQDRLVKELRLRGISNREAANAYAPEFIAAYNRRFARAPRNPHDAHRPVEAHVDLDRVFTWQEERRLTGSLTLHYKRVMYVVDPDCEAAKMARGKRVLVRESQAGEIVIEHHGERLPAHAFPKDAARIRQGAIVDNKLLGSTLELIQTLQRERDKAALQTRRFTLREEDLLRKSMGDDGLPHRRSKRTAQQQPHPLADVLEWARAQTDPESIDVQSWKKRAASAIASNPLPKN
jgi:transposase